MASSLVEVRFSLPGDAAFIAASWFESYWKAAMRPTGLEYEVYKPNQDALIRRLLEKSNTLVVVPAAVPDEIMGYAVLSGPVAHYVYVKSAYRRMGVATGLLQQRAEWYSHQTKVGRKLAEKLGLKYNPYVITRL